MNINDISSVSRTNQYSANQKAKTTASFGQQLSEATKQRMQTGSAYETGIHTGPLVTGTEIPAAREGVAVDSTRYADSLLAASRLTAPPVAPAAVAAPVQESDAAEEEPKTYYVEGGPTLIEQFGKFLLENAAKPDHHAVIGTRENSVCSYGHGIGGDQVVYAEYTADSTPEDPIVRILCQSHSGLYEFTRHINDIDPSNCTYAELAALHGHLVKSGVDMPDKGLGTAVPSGYEIGDMMRRQNFVEGLRDLSQSKMFGPGILADAKELAGLYALLAEEKKAMEAEDAEFEALLAAVDNIIENKPVMEPKEILEKLTEQGRNTLEDMKNSVEVSRDRWDALLDELHGMGAISGNEAISAGVHLIPIGYKDENGNYAMYEDVGLYTGLYDRMRAMNDGTVLAGVTQVNESWTGDPMAFLDAWIESLQEWREHLAQVRKEDGALKYDRLDPIERQIEGATSVSALIETLLAGMP